MVVMPTYGVKKINSVESLCKRSVSYDNRRINPSDLKKVIAIYTQIKQAEVFNRYELVMLICSLQLVFLHFFVEGRTSNTQESCCFAEVAFGAFQHVRDGHFFHIIEGENYIFRISRVG